MLQGVDQSVFIDQGAPCGIYQDGAWLHLCQLFGADQMLGFWRESNGQNNNGFERKCSGFFF